MDNEYKAMMFDRMVYTIKDKLVRERIRVANTQIYYDYIKEMPEARNKDIVLHNIEDAKSSVRAYEVLLAEFGITEWEEAL